MRRFVFVILVSYLLLTMIFVQERNIPAVEASSSIYQGDLVLTGNNVTTIEGSFDINGSIIVEDNATLILKNAIINFTQTMHWQYNMSFQDPLNGNPRLQAINTTIVSASDFAFEAAFFQNSSGNLLNCTIPWRGELNTHDVSAVSVTNSTIRQLTPTDNSTMTIYNSTIDHVYLYNYCEMYVTNATVGIFTDYSMDCYLSVWNSTVLELSSRNSLNTHVYNSSITTVYMKSESINCSITDFTVENVTFWNSWVDFSIAASATGYAANVTLENTRVEKWRFLFYGQSNVTVTNSTLTNLDAYQSSTMLVSHSTVESIYSRGSSSVSISNCTIKQANSGDYTTMSISNTTVIQFVDAEDYSILRLINTECVNYRSDDAHIYFCWYLNLHVVDSEGNDVPNAEITALYSNSTIAQEGTTNVNGKVKLVLAEKTRNATGIHYFGNYTVEAVYESYSDYATVNMTENKQVILTLEDFVIPEFSSLVLLSILITATIIVVIVNRRKQ